MRTLLIFISAFLCINYSCITKEKKHQINDKSEIINTIPFKNTSKVIHVFVALCDNKYQGIVPVPPKIGNGQDPENNLYWGCGFGIKTFFKKSKEWQLVKSEKYSGMILERLIFKYKTKDVYLIADAYNGKEIENCTKDFLNSNAGNIKDTIIVNKKTIGINANANLVAYIGHNGLMDFNLSDDYNNSDSLHRDCIILACKSQKYFSNYIKNSKSNPLIWTTQFMAPEAYTLHDALTGYANKENATQIHLRAAKAYSKYQKCSINAAKKLIATGF